jgi:NCS1 nucleoside transporter family
LSSHAAGRADGRAPVASVRGGRDFVELTEDVSHSPLWNPDLAPTTLEARTWSTWHIAALWIGMSVVITTYTLASGLMQQGMTWWQALFTILLGNAIVLVPMVLNAHAGTKYGVSFPVLCRAAFGVKGANVPAILRAIVACGWFGIQTWIGGLALHALMTAAWSGWTQVPGAIWIAFAVFWLIQAAIIVRGLEGIKLLESWSAPLLLGGGVALLAWAVYRGGGLGRILAESGRLQQGQTPFWTLFPAGLTANVGYWATLSLNIPDFTRYARSQRSQVLGQALGLPTTMTAFAFVGVAVTSATIVIFGEAIWDPVVLVARIGSPTVIIFGALVILAAQLTTNMAANVVSPGTVRRQPLPLAVVGEGGRVEQRHAGVAVATGERAQQRLGRPQVAGVVREPQGGAAASQQREPGLVRDHRDRAGRLPPAPGPHGPLPAAGTPSTSSASATPAGPDALPGVCHGSPSTVRKLLVTHRSRRH